MLFRSGEYNRRHQSLTALNMTESVCSPIPMTVNFCQIAKKNSPTAPGGCLENPGPGCLICFVVVVSVSSSLKKRAGENRLSPFKTTPIYKYQLLLKSIRITATYILKYRFLSLDTFNLVMICPLSTRLNLFGMRFLLVQKPIARFSGLSRSVLMSSGFVW